MITPETPVRDFLASAMSGSLVIQRARALNLNATGIRELTPDQIRVWASEFDALGIDPELLSEHAIHALILLLSEPDNREQLLRCFSHVLWEVLGDPRSGDPPEIYRKAAISVWYAFLVTLDPSIQQSRA